MSFLPWAARHRVAHCMLCMQVDVPAVTFHDTRVTVACVPLKTRHVTTHAKAVVHATDHLYRAVVLLVLYY